MDTNSLHRRLEIWRYILFMNLGASLVLIATGVAELPNIASKPYFPGWYGVWFVVQLASFLPGFVLLWGKHWIQIPLRERLNTIFGYFVVTWLTILPIGLRMGPNAPDSFNYFFLGCAAAIAAAYWWLRRKSVGMQNEIFP